MQRLALLFTVLLAFGCGKKAEEGGLRFRFWGDTSEIGVINESIGAFEAANPGIKVHPERKSADANYAALLVSEFATGTAPDVIFLGDLNGDKLVQTGKILPLDDFIKADPEVKISDYYPAMISRFSYEGKLYFLPRDIAPIACVYYNKSLFDKAKLPYPKESWNWDDLKKTALKLTDLKAPGGAVFGFSEEYPSLDPWILAAGGTLVDNPAKPTRITMGDPKAIKGLLFRLELLHNLKVMPSSADSLAIGGGIEGMFLSGKLAMFFSGIWKTPTFRKIKDFDWDVVPFPAAVGEKQKFVIAGSGYGIASTAKDPAAAWKLVRYLAGKEGQRKLASTGLAQPAIKAMAQSPAFVDDQKPLNKKMLLKLADMGYPSPAHARWNEFADGILRPKTDTFWVPGYNGDAAAAMKAAVDEGNKLLFGEKTK